MYWILCSGHTKDNLETNVSPVLLPCLYQLLLFSYKCGKAAPEGGYPVVVLDDELVLVDVLEVELEVEVLDEVLDEVEVEVDVLVDEDVDVQVNAVST